MKQNKDSIVLGVTGGIGSGKSTVSGILQELGAMVIDADVISRQIVMPGEKALEELLAVFGRDMADNGGQLQRKKLAEEVFRDKDKLQRLNGIMHKHVAQRIQEKVEELLAAKTRVIVIDAPIPVGKGFLDLCDQVWTVTASKELRIDRIIKRSGMTYDEAVSRINSQIREEEYMAIANIVIYNDKDYLHLKEMVKYQFNSILQEYNCEQEFPQL
ncbi:dephospho-CoA kinase [Ruminiclostridium sufflavum DSM 19573]|uniref:Dephospho-CoA kinase n=1 Tax=Ruminiclostridium sufflavum DSM 19573 TaxID=1121337 RepID=A0A318XPH8_9FIRM|nr:dephospho-CoA kinase [Ruminiclostridium sufflavum]PYG89794.1 dephospho-CoA kinase [Ruminiclostridium sufflavum DSM 19573]